MKQTEPLIWDYSRRGRSATSVPALDVPEEVIPGDLARPESGEGSLRLPEVSELDLVRHFTRLSQLNFSIDTQFYPLGSCTMKYNPKVNETVAAIEGFGASHPLAPENAVQGSLQVIWELQDALCAIGGFAGVSLQPAAGAHGELAGVLMIRAYHHARGDRNRTRMLIPDSAHGTNPASVAMAGFEAVQIPSDQSGNVDLAALRALCDDRIAGLMITNPNTLGLFEAHIKEVVAAVHDCGGLVYGDGANLNAILGVLRPGDIGIDVMHFNLHKTFSTPHGGGGPGSGPVGAAQPLLPYLPGPVVAKTSTGYSLIEPPSSIGPMKAFFGNFGMILRALTYIRMHGADGLREVAENAVLNANYLKHLLADVFPARYRRSCMHEFVVSGHIGEGVETMDVAKRLLDYGFHAPTVYFPLIVKDAMMIEPTETESRETLEAFAAALHEIAREAHEHPETLHDAPVTTPVSRVDEVRAAKAPVLRYCPEDT
ncbi:MAG TPA: aminomethyl-transferring glycine dehydrogenase subunit GcvPB [Spirochaetia bacterium]|nr:aminomethyl-transferring glycine dehydrogenase subunit GcvPB [Spirochaetia bacterium]